jgi:ribosomal protein S18 acetylase RimI-like enzyme
MPVDFLCLHDKATIEAFLRRQTELHLYEIGDLDDFFWPHTLWFARPEGSSINALCLLYVGQSQPTLLALGDAGPLTELVKSISGLLPSWFYAHVSPGVEAGFKGKFSLEPHGDHWKMSLLKPTAILGVGSPRAERLGPEHLEEVLVLYRDSYPGNWFDPRMLETREYFGVRDGKRLVSIAGIHVFSPVHRVAAVGNIATAPSHRKRGLAAIATRALCLSLLDKVDHIGLNVGAANKDAIKCYRRLGFETVAPYREFSVHKLPEDA